jgi:hypothetical protein
MRIRQATFGALIAAALVWGADATPAAAPGAAKAGTSATVMVTVSVHLPADLGRLSRLGRDAAIDTAFDVFGRLTAGLKQF